MTLVTPPLLGQEIASASGHPTRETSVIFMTLGGDPSQLDTYDLKPGAPAEYLGPFSPIQTSVPGVQFWELFPR